MKHARSRWLLGVGVVVGMLFLQACPAAKTVWNGQVIEPPVEGAVLVGTNWDGQPFQLSDVQGKIAVVFFGYTLCPDVCPFTLAKMKQVFSQLGERADEVAMIFVSVDPQRDSIERLASYVPNFDQRFYGLRLEAEQIDEVDEAFDLTVQYGQPKDGPGTDSYYYVDHTGTYFLFDRQGRLRVQFPPNAKVDKILPDLQTLLDE